MVDHAPSAPVENLSRYVVGIDLGTTNSAVAYVNTAVEAWRVETFAAPQLVAPGQVEARETLPSFHYEAAAGEFSPQALALPWSKEEPGYAVGVMAREQGMLVPGRAIQSAKSWLCHTGVDRTAELLPWQGAADVERLSPVEVSSRYLRHIAEAWNARFPTDPLDAQDVVLTLPASFDEVARELTVKSAAAAGLPRVVLIEEPQAAFYAWIDAHRDNWQRLVEPGQKILVCDIGGGTTDFTLIRVRESEGGKIHFHRVAVGEHLILGGDNLDLALARHVEQKLAAGRTRGQSNSSEGEGSDVSEEAPQRLEPRQWAVLVRTCRHVKETLLSDGAPERYTIHLPGAGSRLLGGGTQVEVLREDTERLLIEGFLERASLDDKPQTRRSGFQEFGLPYAADPAITRYLATFLTAHRFAGASDEELAEGRVGCAHQSTDAMVVGTAHPTGHDPARPDIVLFNGGFFESRLLRERLLDALRGWFRTPAEPDWEPIILKNERLDLAVARGAAYYGMVRRGKGERIAAGLARTYYVGVEGAGGEPMALCVVPAGTEPGQPIDLTERRFEVRISEPIEFPLYVSSTRLTDRTGELVPVDPEQIKPLPPIRTVLRSGRKDSGSVPVFLHASLTEIGTLDISCREIDGPRSWRLQFDVRSATRTDIAAHESAAEAEGVLDEEAWQRVQRLIAGTFGPKADLPPASLAKHIARELSLSRGDWPTSLLRRMWDELLAVEAGRRKSAEHEARWLNLLGFALRPGYGFALDDWRVAETWRLLSGKLVHPSPQCRAEWWILWRRVGGGLSTGWQQSLATPLIASIRQLHKQVTTGRGKGGSGVGGGSHEAAEIWRLLGSFELLSLATKIELAEMTLDLAGRPKLEPLVSALVWAVGRLGSREPLYGPLNAVVPPQHAAAWAGRLVRLDLDDPAAALALMQLTRRTDDRFRDVPHDIRRDVLIYLKQRGAPAHFRELIATGGTLDEQERGLVFGESLPKGLRLG
ncbi:MAG: hsp70 family protein [Planctomycetes bacterium]|nr:hsp70 family protein [Planctomycetota bacterium]